MASRIIFIDIDGVFHPTTAIAGFTPDQNIRVYAEENDLMRWSNHLAELLEAHGDVMLIAHSSWRKEFKRDEIKALMGPLKNYFEDVTNTEHAGRYDSILRLVDRLDVASYLILDDNNREFPVNCPELAICDPLLGISEPAVQSRVRQWLEATRPDARS